MLEKSTLLTLSEGDIKFGLQSPESLSLSADRTDLENDRTNPHLDNSELYFHFP